MKSFALIVAVRAARERAFAEQKATLPTGRTYSPNSAARFLMNHQTSFVNFSDSTARNERCKRWNALWETSTSRFPLSRWEHIELWRETFAPNQSMQGLIIERDNHWIAALPLVTNRLLGMLSIGDVPYDDWTDSPEWIVAENVADDPTVYDQLVAALRKLRYPLVRVALLAKGTTANLGFEQAIARAGLAFDIAARYKVGMIDVCGPNAPSNWEAYQAAWSGNFRRQMRKMMRRAEELGGVELVVHQPANSRGVDELIREGFAIEDQSWKGRNGTSVMRSPGMLEFFIRQAQLLADQAKLTLLFLRHGGQSIAFEYGWTCRRIYYSPKVGFDDRFSHLSPGQVLRLLWLEKLFAERTHDAVDFAGPLSEATEKWTTRSYPMQRLITATGATGRILLGAGRAALQLRTQAKAFAAKAKKGWNVPESSTGVVITDRADVVVGSPDPPPARAVRGSPDPALSRPKVSCRAAE